jgi:cytochrome c peroxidase
MVLIKNRKLLAGVAAVAVIAALGSAFAQQGPRGKSSYMPVDITESFSSIFARLSAQKPEVTREHSALLNARYDLSNRPAAGVTMDRTKPVQEGVRVKLSPSSTWESLAAMTPEQIRDGNLFPQGFYPLPHPKHSEGGFVFPHFLIDEIKRQEGRDLTRFDVEYDIPDHFLPEFPPAIYLNQRSDLGDVSQGKLVTIDNYYELFNGIIPPKQIEGLRLLVTPFPQQQFNQTEDRRSELPSRGAACFDCHSNGHTNKATHLAPDARPQESRHRVTTPTLRGVQIQRLFGSQRALKTVEDFTQFEQAGAYFDGDHVIAAKKGLNPLDRLNQVDLMAEFQEELAFAPAPKLDVFGKLDPTKATPGEVSGQDIFFGKGQCSACHAATTDQDLDIQAAALKREPPPPGPDHANDSLATGMHADGRAPVAGGSGCGACCRPGNSGRCRRRRAVGAAHGLHPGVLTGIASRAASVIAGAPGMRPARSEHSWRGAFAVMTLRDSRTGIYGINYGVTINPP